MANVIHPFVMFFFSFSRSAEEAEYKRNILRDARRGRVLFAFISHSRRFPRMVKARSRYTSPLRACRQDEKGRSEVAVVFASAINVIGLRASTLS